MEILVSILFFLAIILFLRTNKFFASQYLNAWILPSAFALKCGVGLLFLQFYIFQHEDPHLKNDAGAFYHEAQILNTVLSESPSDYMKLISGIGASEELSLKYLGETNHWDSGKQAVFHDNRNIIRVHAIIDLFSVGSIIVHMLLFCFISLIGTYLLFLALRRYSALKPWLIFMLLLLLPNVLFWSSGILKEPLIVFGIGALAFALTAKSKRSTKIAIGALGLIVMLSFKPYIFIALLAGGYVYLIYKLAPKYKLISALGVPIIMGCIAIFAMPSVVDKGTHLLSRKQFDFSNVGRGGVHVRYEPDSVFYYFSPDQYDDLEISGDSVWLKNEIDAWKVKLGDLASPVPIHIEPNEDAWLLHFDHPKANSFIEISAINDEPKNLLTSAPKALFNSVIRPLPTDPGGKLKYLAFLETLLLIGFVVLAILQRKELSSNQRGFIVSAIVFSILLALLIGWTTPVLGAIHRYRLPIQSAILCCIIVAWRPSRKFSGFKRLKK
ncbi:MAG: hypothetical protein P8P74_07960 [Crocinitomicaceae bacterium]|nr:hypothetical protein [Crocinitomicaceae bacterium]